MKKTIAILFHENTQERNLRKPAITYLADIWRQDGHKVVFLFGTRQFVPADICIVHVDLSVVPEEYLSFAKGYPIVLNGEVKDIRKTSFSKNIIGWQAHYEGPVIVKSDLNYAGDPERTLNQTSLSLFLSKLKDKLTLAPKRFYSPKDYRIYERLSDVPRKYFRYSDFVVEKFLPEKKGDLYFMRAFHFLGDCVQCLRLASKLPIVNGDTCISIEVVEPHPEVLKLQKETNFDYGKFDYCLHKGNVVLLDMNKTTGFGSFPYSKELTAMRRQRAQGLYGYF